VVPALRDCKLFVVLALRDCKLFVVPALRDCKFFVVPALRDCIPLSRSDKTTSDPKLRFRLSQHPYREIEILGRVCR